MGGQGEGLPHLPQSTSKSPGWLYNDTEYLLLSYQYVLRLTNMKYVNFKQYTMYSERSSSPKPRHTSKPPKS